MTLPSLCGQPALSEAQQAELVRICDAICRPGAGILAADETPAAMADRFASLGIENTKEIRRSYRELLFTVAPDRLQPISGVILNKETLDQQTGSGQPLLDLVTKAGIVPGVTVDLGWVPLASSPTEVFTQGLDGLDGRCAEYKRRGCQFAKWRMVVNIGPGLPSVTGVEEGARAMAVYATVCQRNG